MADLSEFVGDAALRKSIETKKKKTEAKLAVLIFSRIAPLEKEIAMYQELLDTIDRAAVHNKDEFWDGKLSNNEYIIDKATKLNQDDIPAPTAGYNRL